MAEKSPDVTAQHDEAQVEHTGDLTSDPKGLLSDAAARGQALTGYEDRTVWETVKAFKVVSLVCFLVALSAATDGYQISLVGNIVANAGFVEKFGTDRDAEGNRVLDSTILSAWTSIGSAGQIIGMVSLSFFSGRYGRKFAMYTTWILLAISVLIECVAPNWQVWLVAKLFGGIGVGCLQTTAPTYIAEVAPTQVRGAFLMCYSLWWITGQFFAPVALQVMSKTDPSNYLTPVYTQWSQIGLMLIIYVLVPESPVWCVTQDKPERAKKSLRFLYRGVDNYDVDHQYDVLRVYVDHEREVAALERSGQWWAIFKGTDGLRTLVSCWTLMAQQFIGLGLFLTYGSYFFQQAGVEDPFLVTCITSGINIVASVCVIYLSESLGRRRLACWGTTLCWFCNILLGILGVVPQFKATNILLIVVACFWNIGLVSQAAVGWGFIGEISSQRLRHYTAGFAAASTCVAGLAMGFLIPPMISAQEWNWGLKTGWFFAGVGLIFTAGVWLLIPETSGRSPAELDELFERKVKPWRFETTTTATQRALDSNKE